MDKRLVFICEICGVVLEDEHHCKAQCPNCGRMLDCSDLPVIRANGMIDDEAGEVTMAPGGDPLEMAAAAAEESAAIAQQSTQSTSSTLSTPSIEPPPTTLHVLRPKEPAIKPEEKRNIADLP